MPSSNELLGRARWRLDLLRLPRTYVAAALLGLGLFGLIFGVAFTTLGRPLVIVPSWLVLSVGLACLGVWFWARPRPPA